MFKTKYILNFSNSLPAPINALSEARATILQPQNSVSIKTLRLQTQSPYVRDPQFVRHFTVRNIRIISEKCNALQSKFATQRSAH